MQCGAKAGQSRSKVANRATTWEMRAERKTEQDGRSTSKAGVGMGGRRCQDGGETSSSGGT